MLWLCVLEGLAIYGSFPVHNRILVDGWAATGKIIYVGYDPKTLVSYPLPSIALIATLVAILLFPWTLLVARPQRRMQAVLFLVGCVCIALQFTLDPFQLVEWYLD